MQPYQDVSVIAQLVRNIVATPSPLAVERVTEGASTIVYRICLAERTFYLRIWPESDESFAPEVFTHQRLRAAGVHVPEIVYFEHYHALIQRSLMLTTAIAGQALGYNSRPAATQQILYQAGRELAMIHQVAVQGYGWIKRDTPDLGLCAEYPTLSMWLAAHFEEPIRALHHCHFLTQQDVNLLLEILDTAREQWQHEAAVLAHGDFDATHIYYSNDAYTGMIDFGEIRGTHQLYDLGHFAIENGDLLSYLLTGYAEVVPLRDDSLHQIHLTGLLIASRRIGRRLIQKRDPHPPDVAFVRRMLPNLGFRSRGLYS